MPEKLDFSKKYKKYYSATKDAEVVELGDARFLSLEGKGAPEGEAFLSSVGALYSVAYGVKKICKESGNDFTVPKLEGLWWVESGEPFFQANRSDLCWKLLIRMPDFADKDMVETAKAQSFDRKGLGLIKNIDFETINEGKCIQILHVGPYATEPETIKKVYALMKQNGYVENGLHHEIYLSNPERTAPEKLKTILRQPIR